MSSIYSWNVQGTSFFFFGKDPRERTLETTPSDYPLHSFICHSHSRCDTHRPCLYLFSSPAFVWALLVWRYPRSFLPLGTLAGMEAPILQRTFLGMGTMLSNMPLRAFHLCPVETLADCPTALQLLILPLLPSPPKTKSFSLNSFPSLTNTCVYPNHDPLRPCPDTSNHTGCFGGIDYWRLDGIAIFLVCSSYGVQPNQVR